MKNKKENSIESEIVKFCEIHGIITYKMKGNRGTPDRVFFKNGACMVMELKQVNGVVSKLQLMECKKLREECIPVTTPFSLEDAISDLKHMFPCNYEFEKIGVSTHQAV